MWSRGAYTNRRYRRLGSANARVRSLLFGWFVLSAVR